jgi:hypothetical protein
MIRAAVLVTAAALYVAAPASAQTHDHSEHAAPQPGPPLSAHQHPAPEPAPQAAPPSHDHMQHGQAPAQQSALGNYPMSRDASGTSWQPDAGEHGGVHSMAGDWMLMGHVLLNGVYDWQDGPRGDEKAFIAGMVMGAARRDFASRGTLNLRAMLAPDPAMGADGYPLLFAAGETANGEEPLVDRQHPHDLFMELSASYTQRLGADNSVFIYGGLPGEPAFGPPAFMHRMSAMDSPEAPITHHWFDSTHITFGVLTAGWVHDKIKLEASRFRGREPDQHRYDIETGELDSTAIRASWNPTQNLSLQVSWAGISSPEALEPDEDEERWSGSGAYTRRIGEGWWSATLAYANKERSDGVSLDAWLIESAIHPNDRWTFFTRGERIETDELEGHGHGRINSVTRISLGALRDFRIHENAVIGVGALAQQHFAPDELEPLYGGDPIGAMAFIRLKID